MRQSVVAIIIILASLAGIFLINCVYVVAQTEQAIITQFGKPVRTVTEPGLHWKTPMVELVHKFDKRILEWDGYPSEIPTADKKFIWVDVTGRWRIQDSLSFFKTMHNEANAQSRLDDIMDGVTRNFITRYQLPEIIRTSNHILSKPEDKESEDEPFVGETDFDSIEVGRDEITRQILSQARGILKDYGIELIDIRIKRINYIEPVLRKVYERMISERKRAAEELRSQGQGIRAEIEGQKEKELKRITSEAYAKSQKIKGEADGEATRVYAEAYTKDPDFYAFLATLDSYDTTLKDARLVLTTDSDFLGYLKDSGSAAKS